MAKNFLGESDKLDTGSNVGVLSVPKGIDIIRITKAETLRFIIVPYTATESPYADAGELWYTRDYWIYRGLGANQKGFCLDNKKTFGERCAITEALMDYDGEADKKPKSQRKALVNLYFPDTDELKIIDHSYAMFMGKLIESMKTKLKSKYEKYKFLEHFCDPKEPTIIDVTFKEESLNGHKYYEAADFEYEASDDPIPKAILEKAADLDKMLIKMSYAEVAATFLGEESDPEPAAELPKATKRQEEEPAPKKEKAQVTKQAEEPKEEPKPKPPAKEWGSEIVAGSILFHGDRKVEVMKVKEDVVTVEYQDDESTAKVNAKDLTKAAVAKEKPKASKPKSKETVPAEGSDMPWDADWQDAE